VNGLPAVAADQLRSVDHCSILDTTELRWFVAGSLTPVVRRWFTVSTSFEERRCDTYLLDGRSDFGLKRRFQQTLELKVRRSVGRPVGLGNGLSGALEEWRRWSPVHDEPTDETDRRWVDVHKSIVERRFSVDGTEIPFSPDPRRVEAGCDVEVVGITVGDTEGWTFAFAAFGPPATRRDALLATWNSLICATPRPESFIPRAARAMGYPAWLAHIHS